MQHEQPADEPAASDHGEPLDASSAQSPPASDAAVPPAKPTPPPINADSYHVELPDGQRFGPVGLDGLAQWAREQRIPPEAMIIDYQGNAMRADVMPELRKVLAAPPTAPVPHVQPADDRPNAISTVIPYRNPPALFAYYLTIFALFPFLGLVFGLAAFVFGIIGLRGRKANPKIKGSAHAWIGVIIGGLLALAWGTCLLGLLLDWFSY